MGYRALAHAIVIRACDDYVNVKKDLYRTPGDTYEQKRKRRDLTWQADLIARFLTSQWQYELTGMDGEYILNRLDSKLRKEVKIRDAGKRSREDPVEGDNRR